MKNLIIITSVINTSPENLNYGPRSIYSLQQRYEQTLKTIESCYKIKDKEILLVETSTLSKEMEEELKCRVDYFYNFGEREEIRKKTDGKYKASAESTQIWEGLKKIDIHNYDNIFKISGRYFFNEYFDYEKKYKNNDNVFKEGPNKTALATVMYKINKTHFEKYLETIEHCKDSQKMLEQDFIKFFSNNYITFDKIGVEGNVSVDGNYINW